MSKIKQEKLPPFLRQKQTTEEEEQLDFNQAVQYLNHRAGQNNRGSIEDALAAAVERFGGHEQIADKAFDTYNSAKAGSAIRARIIELIYKLQMAASSRGNDQQDDLDSYTQEQLAALIRNGLGYDASDTSEKALAGGSDSPASDDGPDGDGQRRGAESLPAPAPH